MLFRRHTVTRTQNELLCSYYAECPGPFFPSNERKAQRKDKKKKHTIKYFSKAEFN